MTIAATLIKRALQLLMLTVVGIVVAAVVIGSSEAGLRNAHRWTIVSACSLLLFGTLIYEFSRSARSWRFWCVLGTLAAVHVGVYSIMLRYIDTLRATVFPVLSIVEYAILSHVLQRLGFNDRPASRRRRRSGRSPSSESNE